MTVRLNTGRDEVDSARFGQRQRESNEEEALRQVRVLWLVVMSGLQNDEVMK